MDWGEEVEEDGKGSGEEQHGGGGAFGVRMIEDAAKSLQVDAANSRKETKSSVSV